MEKFIYYNILYDIYGNFLTKKNAKIFALYYAENLTMQEIADLMQVSKSYIGSCIKRSEKKLEELENQLHIYQLQETLKEILKLNDLKKIKLAIQKILNNADYE